MADNYTKNKLVQGSSSADTINNYAGGVTVQGLGGDDYLYNSTEKNYTIKGAWGYVTLDGGAGDDIIFSYDPNVSINGGTGDDEIILDDNCAKITVKGSAGNDTVYTESDRSAGVLFQYSKGDGYDYITNWSSSDTLSLGSGIHYTRSTVGSNVVVSIAGSQAVTLDGAKDKTVNVKGGNLVSVVDNFTKNKKVSGSSSADIIQNHAGGVTLAGGGGNDSIYNSTEKNYTINSAWGYVTIDAGAGNDSVFSYDPNVSINGGEGNDKIILDNNCANITVKASTGNDTIYTDSSRSYGVLFQYSKGDGFDSITNWNSNDTLSLGSGISYTRETVGSNVVVSVVEAEAVTLNGAKDKTVNIKGGSLVSVVDNFTKNKKITGTSSDDTINNYAGGVTIAGGAGVDSIYNSTSSNYTINNAWGYVTIDGGNGNDLIYNYDPRTSINGGAGSDKITLHGNCSYITVKGSTGNDTIFTDSSRSAGVLFQYNSGDGYDLITNWNSNDTLSLGSVTYTRSTVGSDVVVSIQGGEALTLQGAANSSVSIVGGTLTTGAITNYTKNKKINGSSSADTINNHAGGVTVLGNGGNDSIYNSTWSSYTINGFYGYVTIDGSAGNDTITSYDPFVSINGGAGKDLINLSDWRKITVKGGAGDDTVNTYSSRNYGVLFQYNSGDGFDLIKNWNSSDTLSLASDVYYSKETVGSDVVVSIEGGGALTLEGAKDKTLNINGGNPNLVIYNFNTNSLVSGSGGKDTIDNSAGGVTIQGLGGNDSIYNSTSSYHTIKNSWGYVTIDGGAGNDLIYSYDPRTSINGGAGSDKITLHGDCTKITVKGSTGNDTIFTDSSRDCGVLFQYAKGDGFDSITNWSSNDTLSLGSGISYSLSTVGANVVVSIESGGALTLSGGKDKTVKIVGGTNIANNPKGTLISNSNSNVSLKGTNYADTVNNNGSLVTISTAKGNDSIYNWADKVTVYAGDGKDTLRGGYSNSKLFGEGGNDLISLTGAYWRNTLSGGADDDIIFAEGNEHSVDGGAGSDKITLTGDKLTVKGGADDDTIYGNTATSHLYQYAKGDGNDLIYNWSSSDSLTLTGGASWTKKTSGNNVIITVKDSGKITLSGAKDKTVNIYPASEPSPAPTTSSVTGQEVIKNFMKILDTSTESGLGLLNAAVNYATGGYFDNIGAAIEQMTLDCSAAGNATKFLKNYCGIDLTNADTGALTGYDAGGSSIEKTASSIVPESGALTTNTDASFKANSKTTVQLASYVSNGSGFSINDSSYGNLKTDVQKYIWRAFKTWWAKGALDLISATYGSNYNFTNSVGKLYFGFFDEPRRSDGSIVLNATNKGYSNGNFNSIVIRVNSNQGAYGVLMNGGNPDGQISEDDTFYLDRVLAHEMTHAVMMINVDDFNNLPQFIAEGTAELTHGIDDNRGNLIKSLAGNASALNDALDLYDYGTGNQPMYAAGYMFLRYLAKQGAEHYPTSGNYTTSSASRAVSTGSGSSSSSTKLKSGLLTLTKDYAYNMLDLSTYSSSVKKVDATAMIRGITIVAGKNATSISAGAGADTLSGNIGNDTLIGNAGNDMILGNAGNDILFGNDGNDTLNGGTGTNTLTGGAGKDIFVHKAGSDIITDYVVGEDKIKLPEENHTIVDSYLSGNDVVLVVEDSGTVTVQNAKGKKITVVDYKGKSTSAVYGNSTSAEKISAKTLTVTNNTAAAVTLGSSYYNADASKRTKAIQITGNAKANTISGGSKADTIYGGKGNDSLFGGKGNDQIHGGASSDTLYGGAGNDSLWGDAGNDTFFYTLGDGKDVIYGFEDGDTLTLDNLEFTTAYSKKNGVETVTFTFDSGSVTLKDFSATTFNVNNSTYKISGNSLALK